MGCYDRQGNPITHDQWGALLADHDYKVVVQEVVEGYFVSTVWVGLDHGYGWAGGPPLIFETMVFEEGSWQDKLCERYTTEAEARRGHDAVVTLIRATARIV